MNIYEAIKKDHEALLCLATGLLTVPTFDRLTKSFLVENVISFLELHAKAKEAVLYTPLASLGVVNLAITSRKEQYALENMSHRLISETLTSNWTTIAAEFKQLIEMHIRQEESFIFFLAKNHFSDFEAYQLGLAFEYLKAEIKNGEMGESSVITTKKLMPPRLTQFFSWEC